ncbi:MAG: helix-turn-helix transcriptional regulator [Propionibacteriaceae bacterium]|nr:helix-turn-helix transcriptional regulator [Propionibacteriaceae bacterium]
MPAVGRFGRRRPRAPRGGPLRRRGAADHPPVPAPRSAPDRTAHRARGPRTRNEAFLAGLIATHRSRPGTEDAELSTREREILGYLATTMSAAEIRDALFISQNTLKTHLRSIYRKLGVGSRREAARVAQHRGTAVAGHW